MEYQIGYDVTVQFLKVLWVLPVGVLLVMVGAGGLRLSYRFLPRSIHEYVNLMLLAVLVAGLVLSLASLAAMKEYLGYSLAMYRGEYFTVEGWVLSFRTTSNRAIEDHFTVAGIPFSSGIKPHGFCYTQTQSNGGLIGPGAYVRIHYVKDYRYYPPQRCIIQFAIRQDGEE